MTPRFSRFRGGFVVGSDYFVRRSAFDDGRIARGIVDDIADLAHPGIDVSRIAPSVRAFFEDTASLDLYVKSSWRFPFSIGWRALRPLMMRVGQFVLPSAPSGEAWVSTTTHALAENTDGRPNARAIVRRARDETAHVFQVVAYSTWQRGSSRFMSAAFPLPGGQLAGILRLDPLGGVDGGVVLTSTRKNGDDAGVWFIVGPAAIRAPLSEQLALWPATDDDARVVAGTTLRGRHEQRAFGVVFAVHDYWFVRGSSASTENENATRST